MSRINWKADHADLWGKAFQAEGRTSTKALRWEVCVECLQTARDSLWKSRVSVEDAGRG